MKHTLTTIKDINKGDVDITYRNVNKSSIIVKVITEPLYPKEFPTVPPAKRVY
jgi:hypothetical protein